jgi:SNF2 family DNA or RNA helicase
MADDEIQDIDKQIDELMRKRRELEEAERRKERVVIININKFNPITGKCEFTLSRYREDVVNYLRYYMERAYYRTSSGEDKNVVSIFNLDAHIEKIKEMGDVEFLWNKTDLERFNEYKNAPDIAVSVNEEKSYVLLKLGPKIRTNQFYITQHIATLTVTTEGLRFSLAEFHAFPDTISKLYPAFTVTYTDRAKEILVEQLNRQKILAELANAKDAPDIINPFVGVDADGVLYDLTPHQRVAVKFIEVSGGNGIIAYDMGTGKSAIGIALSERGSYKKVLVICPSNLKTNWKREIKKFTTKEAVVFQGAEPDELSINIWIDGKYQYHIINYDIIGRGHKKGEKDENQGLMKWVLLFSTIKPDYIIIDEGHYVKNMESGRSKGVLTLAANCNPIKEDVK